MPGFTPDQEMMLIHLRESLQNALRSRDALPNDVTPGEVDAYMEEWAIHLQLNILAESVLQPAVEFVGPNIDRFQSRLKAVRNVLDVADDLLVHVVEQATGRKSDEDKQQHLIVIGKRATAHVRTILEDAIAASVFLEEAPKPT